MYKDYKKTEDVANEARISYKKVISNMNNLNYQYADDMKKMIKTKIKG